MHTADFTICAGYEKKKKSSWETGHSRKKMFSFLSNIDTQHEIKISNLRWFDPCSLPVKRPLIFEYDATIDSLLSPLERQSIYTIGAVVRRFAENSSVFIAKINIRVAESDDHFREIICAVHIDATADIAMAFWADLDRNLEEWLDTQTNSTKELVFDQFITAVYWK